MTKRILITGKNSYIGKSLKTYLINNYSDKYSVEELCVRDQTISKLSFKDVDVVVHVAGLAHQKETKKNSDQYYKVNSDLTSRLSSLAKEAGVKHFLYLSSMSVYGQDSGEISSTSIPKPKSHYGKSKLIAENDLLKSVDQNFNVSILRPPMVYGFGCKGNYVKLSKIAAITPIFPKNENKRSMIYIDNLSKYIVEVINESNYGIHCPQDNEYVSTSEMVSIISKLHNKNIKYFRINDSFMNMLLRLSLFQKIFGDLYYTKQLPQANFSNLTENIALSEGRLLNE